MFWLALLQVLAMGRVKDKKIPNEGLEGQFKSSFYEKTGNTLQAINQKI